MTVDDLMLAIRKQLWEQTDLALDEQQQDIIERNIKYYINQNDCSAKDRWWIDEMP